MKFFRKFTPGVALLAVILLVVPVFAVDVSGSGDTDVPGDGEVLTDDLISSAPVGDEPVVDDTPPDTGGGDYDPVESAPDHSYTTVVDAAGGEAPAPDENTPGGFGTLPAFLRAMFGEYTPRTQTVYTYFDGQLLDVSTEYVPGVAGMDMEWIASVLLFCLVVYCLFRMLGGMVR